MWAKLRKYFISGLIIFLPLALTVYLLVLMFNFADGLFGRFLAPYFAREFGFYFRGLSLLICALVILLIGFFATNFLGRRLHLVFEGILLRLPFFKQVYPPLKEIAILLFSRDKPTFKQAVLVEFPRKGVYTMGFLMNDSSKKFCEKVHQDLCNILIPSAPSPITGFIIMVPKSEVILLDISVEDAIKFVVSDGVVNPS